MSLQEIQNTVNEISTNVESILTSIDTVPELAKKTMNRANEIFDKLDPVLTEIHKISNLLLGILIMSIIIIVILFVFWFFRHVYPLLRGLHHHEHNADNVVRDLTEVPVRFAATN